MTRPQASQQAWRPAAAARKPRRPGSPAPLNPGRDRNPCWQAGPSGNLCVPGLAAACLVVAAADAAPGNRAVLIGLLIAGPCCVVLTGRWVPAGLTGLWVTGLAAVLGLPDGIWGTAIFFTWLGAVAGVALASTTAAAFIQALSPARLR